LKKHTFAAAPFRKLTEEEQDGPQMIDIIDMTFTRILEDDRMMGDGVRHPDGRESAAGDHPDYDCDDGVVRRTHENVLWLAVSRIEGRPCHLLQDYYMYNKHRGNH
jgi:hypothetical protein